MRFPVQPAGSDRLAAISAVSLYAGIFVLTGTHLPYFPLWLSGEGFSEREIATILGAPMLLRVIAPPLITALADRFGILLVLALCYLGCAAACLGFLVLDGFSAILLCSVVLGFLLAPTAAMSDAIVGLTVQNRPQLIYGRIRGVSSIFFMLANIIVGALLPVMPHDAIVVIMLAAAIVATLILIPASRHLVTSARRVDPATASDGQWREGPMVIGAIILASALIQASHAYLYAFGSIEWRRQGISDLSIGFAWSAAVAAEIVLFYMLGSRIKGVAAASSFLVIGGAGAVFRWMLYAQPLPPGAWPIVQMLHAVSFATTHLGAVTLLNTLAPERRRAFAQGILAAVIGGFMAAATLTSDRLYVAFKQQGYYASAGIALAGVLIALYAWRRLQPQSEGSGGWTVPPS